jgi:TRAP transporter TAXI family solute receptor
MKKWSIVGVVVILVVAISVVLGYYYLTAQTPVTLKEPVKLKFATFDVGTSWYLLGGAVSEIFKQSLPAGSTVDVLPYAGGIANNILVANYTADMATSFSLTAKLAYEGIAPMYRTKYDNLRLLAAPLDTYWFGLAVPKDSDIQTFDDIINPKRPIKLGTSTVGGLSEYQLRLILEAYGLTVDDLKGKGVSIMNAGFTTLAREMQAKRLDVISWVVNPGHPTWSELFVNPGMRFVPLPDKVINHLVTKYGLKADKLQKGLFSGSNEAATVMFYTILVVRNDMPEQVAYMLAKALVENKATLETAYPASKGIWDPSKYKNFAVIPYHPGAERYYREKFG